jgi:hypothetical protein
MSLTNEELLIKALKQTRDKAHSELNQLLTSALNTFYSSDDDEMRSVQRQTFNTKCQLLVQEIKEYSERLGKLDD